MSRWAIATLALFCQPVLAQAPQAVAEIPFDSPANVLRFPKDHSIRPVIGNKLDPNATSGTFSPGAPWAICITPGPNQVLYASDAYPGRVYKLTPDGKVLGVIGGPGRQLKQFAWIHEIACPSENVLYVAELLTWRVQKLLLHPTRTAAKAGR